MKWLRYDLYRNIKWIENFRKRVLPKLPELGIHEVQRFVRRYTYQRVVKRF